MFHHVSRSMQLLRFTYIHVASIAFCPMPSSCVWRPHTWGTAKKAEESQEWQAVGCVWKPHTWGTAKKAEESQEWQAMGRGAPDKTPYTQTCSPFTTFLQSFTLLNPGPQGTLNCLPGLLGLPELRHFTILLCDAPFLI